MRGTTNRVFAIAGTARPLDGWADHGTVMVDSEDMRMQRPTAFRRVAASNAISLVLSPQFGPYIAGKVFASTGIWVFNIVAAIFVFEQTGSALIVGLVSVAQFGPQLVLAPYFGAVADRCDRRRLLVGGWLLATAGPGSLSVLVALGAAEGSLGAIAVLASALVLGLGMSVGVPAMQSLLPALVRPDQLASAVAASVVPQTVGRAAGPAIGALVAAQTGAAAAFAIAAAGNLSFVMLTLVIRLSRAEARADATTVDRSLGAGMRHILRQRGLVLLLLGVAVVGIGADPSITLAPPLSAALGRGAELTGVFASSFGVGAGLALLAIGTAVRRFGIEAVSTSGLTILATGMLGLAFTWNATWAILCFGLAGAGMMVSLSGLTTQLQERVPEALRGRVMAFWGVAFLGSRPIAASINGVVADLVSIDAAFLLVFALVAVVAYGTRPSRLRASFE